MNKQNILSHRSEQSDFVHLLYYIWYIQSYNNNQIVYGSYNKAQMEILYGAQESRVLLFQPSSC